MTEDRKQFMRRILKPYQDLPLTPAVKADMAQEIAMHLELEVDRVFRREARKVLPKPTENA